MAEAVTAAGATGESVPLAPGLELRCGMRALDGSLDVSVHHHARPVSLTHATLRPGSPRHGIRHSGRLLQVDFELIMDAALAEVQGTGILKVRDPVTDRWHALLDVENKPLLRYAPAHGSVGGKTEPDPPIVEDGPFGGCQESSNNVTRLFVDDQHRALTDVGRVVKEVMFPTYPDFVFNTVACVGTLDRDGFGGYTDPSSPWFNVFDGYYQIDAPKPDWRRPFGYRSASGIDSQVEFEDLVRLGKSDWNWFSNWMYGVPAEFAERSSGVDMASVATDQSAAGVIGASRWHLASVQGVEFVSAYEAGGPDADRLVDNTVLSPVWRRAYGRPRPKPDWSESFFPTVRGADLYMAYWEDDQAFHTVMFGGTTPPEAPRAFLDAQLAACRAVIERSYPELGFAAA